MATELFKVPQTKRPLEDVGGVDMWSPTKKKRIKETFLNFCDIVLTYTQYNSMRSQDMRQGNRSPLDSTGSAADSYTSDMAYPWEEDQYAPSARERMGGASPSNEVVADDTSFNEITCFCGKPYMGRPMIECSVCLNWLHLSCVHLRKNNIPETYICEACKRSPPHSKSSSARRKTQRLKLQMAHDREKAKIVAVSSSRVDSNSAPSYTPGVVKTTYTPAVSGIMRPTAASVSGVTVGSYSQSADSSGRSLDHAIMTAHSSQNVQSPVTHNASVHASTHLSTPSYGGVDAMRYMTSPILQNSSTVNHNIIDTRKVNVCTWKPTATFERKVDMAK